MSRWFRVRDDLLHDPSLQRMSAEEFRAGFTAAISGALNGFSRHIEGPFIRPSGAEWKAIRDRIFARDDYTCSYCGTRGGRLECDHILPVAKQGKHEDWNLTTACLRCNRSKAGKTLAEWRGA